MSKPTPKRPATQDEILACELLQRVGMSVGCWDKRFRRDVLSQVPETRQISEKACAQMWRLFIRYRRQIGHKDKDMLMILAEANSAPDFRKQRAIENELAKIEKMRNA